MATQPSLQQGFGSHQGSPGSRGGAGHLCSDAEQGVIIDTILHWSRGLVGGLSSSVFPPDRPIWCIIILEALFPSTSGLATVSRIAAADGARWRTSPASRGIW